MRIDKHFAVPAPLSAALDLGRVPMEEHAPLVVGVFQGEGIGPEVVAGALEVLRTLCTAGKRKLDVRVGGAIGVEALRENGRSLTDECVGIAEAVFADGGALFCGAGGARFVYELRARFDLFCKFTPLKPLPELADAALLRPERLAGVDIVAVRENAGGLYFGTDRIVRESGGGRRVETTFGYGDRDVARIVAVADRLARQRRGRATMVVKRDGVAAISDLWIEVMKQQQGRSQVDWDVLDIDNATYQLVADPGRFDVIVSPNMFGDVLADCGASLLASRGMSFSGNYSATGNAVYQTGHGAAYDIAGTDTANPIGQILSLAMMLEESFAWCEGASLVRAAVAAVLARGVRTRDIRGRFGAVVGCREMSQRICEEVAVLAGTAS